MNHNAVDRSLHLKDMWLALPQQTISWRNRETEDIFIIIIKYIMKFSFKFHTKVSRKHTTLQLFSRLTKDDTKCLKSAFRAHMLPLSAMFLQSLVGWSEI